MRAAMCMIFSVALFCAMILGASMPPAPQAPSAAWWGLFCPEVFSLDEYGSDAVTFTWPVFEQILRFFNIRALA